MTPEDRMRNLGSSDASTPSEGEWVAFREAAHRSLARRRAAAMVTGAALIVAIVGSAYAITRTDDGTERPPVVATPTESPQPGPSHTWADERVSKPLNQWYYERDGSLTPFHVYVEGAISPRRLLEWTAGFVPGPLAETGVTSAIPSRTQVDDLVLSGKTAYIALSGPFPKERRKAYAQIVYTLTQFDDVKKVAVAWVTQTGSFPAATETRGDYDDLLPPIVVEAPYGGQEVGRTFTLSGIANVFEATVSYRLVDRDDNVLQEGFTTATCGSGCWGTYEERVTYNGDEKYVILQVFESSAEDGSPLHMISAPLNITKT